MGDPRIVVGKEISIPQHMAMGEFSEESTGTEMAHFTNGKGKGNNRNNNRNNYNNNNDPAVTNTNGNIMTAGKNPSIVTIGTVKTVKTFFFAFPALNSTAMNKKLKYSNSYLINTQIHTFVAHR